MVQGKKATAKQVRDVQGETTEQPESQEKQLQVHQGNIGSLTVQFLNSINNHLYAIRKMMEESRNG